MNLLCRLFTGTFVLVSLISCGNTPLSADLPNQKSEDASADKIPHLESEIEALRSSQEKINTLVTSEFATCEDEGDTKDPLINRMCKVAQAATVESRVLMQAELAKFSKDLGDKVSALSDDLSNINVRVGDVETRVAKLEASVTSLQSDLKSLSDRMTSAEEAISALQKAVEGIHSSLQNIVEAVEIGSENVAAGPLYEVLLRRADRTAITAFVEELSAALAVAENNPIEVTKDSTVATFPQGGDSLVAGDVVRLSGCSGGNKALAVDINGDVVVQSVSGSAFTFSMAHAATRTGSTGGAACTALKLGKRGLARIWEESDGADTAVRTTKSCSVAYNYIVAQNAGVWSVCYDSKNASATFETLKAGGGTVVCK